MKIAAIVQARMSSQRFPGKILYKVNGKPLISFLLDRIRCCSALDIIIATSVDASDNFVLQYCKSNNVICYRGPLDNVYRRFREIIEKNSISAFVRLSADSPFIDPTIIQKGVKLFCDNDYDIVTNVFPRTYPKGQSVEVLRSEVFLNRGLDIEKYPYCEHITTYFYENKDKYRIYNFPADKPAADVQLSVDTAEDMKLFEAIIGKMDKPHWQYSWEEILELRDKILTA